MHRICILKKIEATLQGVIFLTFIALGTLIQKIIKISLYVYLLFSTFVMLIYTCMKNKLPVKNCEYCDAQLKGRVDKRFCDYMCRSGFNNQMRRERCKEVLHINAVLRSNRQILNAIMQNTTDRKSAVSITKLLDLGFNFKYFTHIYKNKNGQVYHFCYEFGFLKLDTDKCLVVARIDN